MRVAKKGEIQSGDLKSPGVRQTDHSHQDIPVTAQVELKVSMGWTLCSDTHVCAGRSQPTLSTGYS